MKAHPLPDGGTIGVPAPASPWEDRSEWDRGTRWWESKGYSVKLSEHAMARDDYVAGDPKDRARDVEAMFADPEVDAVQVFGGGYGSSQVVPHLDLDVIASNPKPFLGYSDITALHIAIRQGTGLVTFHGPGLAGMAYEASKDRAFTQERVLRALTDPAPLGEIPARPDDEYVGALGSGKARAPIVGGNLWLTRETLGTPWEIETAGNVLFFEDVYTPPWHVDGMLTHLANAGKLQDIRGVVVGEMYRPEEWRHPEPWLRSRSMEDVLEYHLGPLGVPVLTNLPLGHGKHLATIPLGVEVTVDADERRLTVEESALEGAGAKGGTS
ncbi:MAG TPA: LD-carboxypeptidase [Actinomycetota bacterium]|nr:LD-carboxypeptidase [Actinomycetota bacterium]